MVSIGKTFPAVGSFFYESGPNTAYEIVARWINLYMEEMTRLVDEFGGMVENFAGDGLMAVWGAPIARKTQMEIQADGVAAVRCALNMATALDRLNARYRRSVRARGHFPNEQAALKCLYLATRSLDPTGKGRARWTMRWKPALNAFAITFEGRITPGSNQP